MRRGNGSAASHAPRRRRKVNAKGAQRKMFCCAPFVHSHAQGLGGWCVGSWSGSECFQRFGVKKEIQKSDMSDTVVIARGSRILTVNHNLLKLSPCA